MRVLTANSSWWVRVGIGHSFHVLLLEVVEPALSVFKCYFYKPTVRQYVELSNSENWRMWWKYPTVPYVCFLYVLHVGFSLCAWLTAGVCVCVCLGLNPKPSNSTLLSEQRHGSLPKISLSGKTRGITKAFTFSQLAQPTAAQPLSHWEAHVIERRH